MDERELLDSWKEIAAFLNRSVMTCHRWEEELGLPIHRLDGTPKARVFAYTDELDCWKAEKMHEHEAEHQAAAEAKTAVQERSKRIMLHTAPHRAHAELIEEKHADHGIACPGGFWARAR